MIKILWSKKFVSVFITLALVLSLLIPVFFVHASEEYLYSAGGATINGKTAYKSGTNNFVYTTMAKGKGKWYYEVKYNSCSGNHQLSIYNNSSKGHYRIYYSQGGTAWRYESHTGSSSTTLKSQNLSLTSGTVMGVAIDGINNKLTCYKNGVEVFSSKFSNFDLETNSFRASVSTGNSPSGSFNVTFALEEGEFKYAIPEGYEPFGKPEPAPEPVKVKKLSVHLKEGETSTLSVTDDLADNVNFTWVSSDTAVAVVNESGMVTAVAEGICDITAKDSNGFEEKISIRVAGDGNNNELVYTRVNDKHPQILYSGNWTNYDDPIFYNGDEVYSNTLNDYAEFHFTGTAIRWIGATSYNLGKCDVYIDNELEAQGLDLYSSTLDTQKILFSKTGLANGNHTIRIVVLEQKNDNAAGYHVTVDAFEYA